MRSDHGCLSLDSRAPKNGLFKHPLGIFMTAVSFALVNHSDFRRLLP